MTEWHGVTTEVENLGILLFFCLFCRDNEVCNDPTVKAVVVDQTKQWSEMMERHRKEEWELSKLHLQAQEDILKKLMEAGQAKQLAELDALFER